MRIGKIVLCGLAFALLSHGSVPQTDSTAPWQTLEPGMDLKVFTAGKPGPAGDARISVLRIDPETWDLEFVGMSLNGGKTTRTAREWCKAHRLSAGINAGMFATDYKTHVGYLGFRGHVNSSHVNSYKSVAAFDPRGGRLPRFRIFDLDEPEVTVKTILRDYASAVQNLRLIKRPGSNVWPQQAKKWSPAVLGEDAAGRILFIFSRSPFSMYDLNRELLAAGIDLVAAQHLEGGPEAQLYVKAGPVELEMFGSFETSFKEDDRNQQPWPIPNVLGVRRRPPAKPAAERPAPR